MTDSLISDQLKHLPASPGVYLLRDSASTILYVGKASNLRQRVKSYFTAPQKLSPKLQQLVAQVNDLEFFITNTEQEALILELNLIKRHRPRYNARLKDDKTFPYLKIDINKEWPRVFITRRLEEDGGRYFGPFANSRSVRQTLQVIKGIFPFRSCTRPITGTDSRACLDYYIHNCLGPCIATVTRQEYADMIRQIILFLEGKQEKVVQQLGIKMREAAEALDFEKAALLRDQIQSIEEVIEWQKITAKVRGEQDVIAFAEDGDRAYFQVFFIRNSKLIGRESFILQGTRSEEPRQIMAEFIKQFYHSVPYIPPLLLLQHPVEDRTVIKDWLQSRRGGVVNIVVPQKGGKKQLVDTVAENATQGLQQHRIKQLAVPTALPEALDGIKRELGLPRHPSRIEGYDISNIQGTSAVGGMVVFEEGKPKPSNYRRFKIRTVSGADDYAMLQEVLRRRFKRSIKSDTGETWAILPDLILIDGGKGQLNAAQTVLNEVGMESVPVASLAKEKEELFVPRRDVPIALPASSSSLQLLQRLRDEAHRFAVGYHRKVHKTKTFTSSLDAVPGIGPKRKRALLKQFGSIAAIRETSVDELAATAGISLNVARKVKELI